MNFLSFFVLPIAISVQIAIQAMFSGGLVNVKSY